MYTKKKILRSSYSNDHDNSNKLKSKKLADNLSRKTDNNSSSFIDLSVKNSIRKCDYKQRTNSCVNSKSNKKFFK